MRRLGAVFLGVALLVSFVVSSKAEASHESAPKLLNLYLDYELTDEAVEKLAKWDLLVLDMDQQFQFPEKIRRLRELNPKIKILAYVSVGEISEARFKGHPASPGRRLADQVADGWFLKKSNGARASWWPGAWGMNATDLSPTKNGERWNSFLGPFIRDELMASGLWDGVFLDGAFDQVSGFYGKDLDPNLDGKTEDSSVVDREYQAGMEKLMRNVRTALGDNRLILNNSSAAYASISNGVLFENFPRYGFEVPFGQLREAISKNPTPQISSINTNTNNLETPEDYRLLRLGLASALIADAYFSFDAGDANHNRTWWYDEYEAEIGQPSGSAKSLNGLWSREYTQGLAVANPTNKTVTYALPGEFEHLTGSQDITANNGRLINELTLAPEDGIVLLRRGEWSSVDKAAYTNGSFLNVFNASGERQQNGFFASRADVAGGSEILSVDLDRDGQIDLVTAVAGKLSVSFASGDKLFVQPFGEDYSGKISVSAGQTDKTATWELVVSPSGSGVEPGVVILDARLSIITKWLAYGENFRNGLSAQIGDLDGDGSLEIVTGPGQGGGPHIRSFKPDGTPWYGGFFAFDAAGTSGANVAVGDLDGDGRDEIVVGSGPGQAPHIRVYDGWHRMKSEFEPSGVGVDGLRPVLADMNGDGQKEILVPGKPF